ncbi:MAG: Fic family protein [Candidatus Fibromonas sp.]|jgi:Fic family protein|nr:Fic family protein [Candidatus Fibromonas sp.]
MVNQTTKLRLLKLQKLYSRVSRGKGEILREISLAEIPESVYNSNAIENSTLSLEDTEKILLHNLVPKELNIREVYEAKNLAKIMEMLLRKKQKLSTDLILNLHKMLLHGIDDAIAGRFRRGKEWVRVGNHIGANPNFVYSLMSKLVNGYNKESDIYFLDKIAHFHAEFETIHPFCDGNGRIGRVLLNQQLMALNLPPIIIPNKSKKTDYYRLFNKYHLTFKYEDFTKIFALLLQESLHKRIAILTSERIIPLSIWAKNNGIKGNSAVNKAKRQTIPAFRMREKWMISSDISG